MRAPGRCRCCDTHTHGFLVERPSLTAGREKNRIESSLVTNSSATGMDDGMTTGGSKPTFNKYSYNNRKSFRARVHALYILKKSINTYLSQYNIEYSRARNVYAKNPTRL